MSFRKIALGLAVSAICLYFVLRNVQWSQVWNHLTQVNLAVFGISMLLMLMAYFLMTWRWQHLLSPLELPAPAPVRPPEAGAPALSGATRPATYGEGKQVGIARLYGMMMTGYFFNSFFPARAGDLVRAHLLGSKTRLSRASVLATIVIEKAFDGIILLLMLLLSLIFLPSATQAQPVGFDPDALAWLAGIGLAVVIVGLALFYRHNARIARFVEKVLGYLPLPDRLKSMSVRLIETFAGGMHVFKNPRPLISAALISVLVWVVVGVMFWVALLSFAAPFPPEMMSVTGILFMTAIVNLGLLVPALPGNVGTYEALVVAVMAFFRVDKDLAVAFALIFHVGQLVTTLLVGLVAFWAQNLSLSEIRPVEEQAELEADSAIADPIS